MSRNVILVLCILVLMYHRHKLLDLINKIVAGRNLYIAFGFIAIPNRPLELGVCIFVFRDTV
jgi:hypothetical protein